MTVVVSLLDFVGQYDASLRMVSQKGGGIEGQQIDMCDAMLTSFIVRVDECIPVFISKFSEENYPTEIRLSDATSSV